MKRKGYLFPLGALVILLALGLGWYVLTHGGARRDGSPIKVRFAGGVNLLSAQLYVALEKGYFTQEGLDVSYSPFMLGKEALQEVVTGRADFATAADAPILLEVLKGSKIFVIATLSSASGLTGIIARRDQGISSVKDLQGKTIGVSLGTNAEFVLDSFLLFYRVPRKDLHVVDVSPRAMAEAFRKGEIQAAVTWEPTLSNLSAQLGENGVIFYGDEAKIYKQTWNLAATQEFVHKKPDSVTRVLRALLKAETFIQENRKEARQIITQYVGVKEGAFEVFWKSYRPGLSLSPLLVENLESQTRWLMKHKRTERKDMPNYLDYIYFEGLESIRPEAVTIVHPKLAR